MSKLSKSHAVSSPEIKN